MLFILALLILKMAALLEFVFLYDTMLSVSLHTQTFMRMPFFVMMVAFFGLASEAAASTVACFIESATTASRCAFSLASSA